MMTNSPRFLLGCILVSGAALGCDRSQSPRPVAVNSQYDEYLRGASIGQLVQDIRIKTYPDKTCLRPEVQELIRRGLPAFEESARLLLEDDVLSQTAAWCILSEITKAHYGYDQATIATRGWPSQTAGAEWERVWRDGDMNPLRSQTVEDRQVIVKKWKQWYAENVEAKRKL